MGVQQSTPPSISQQDTRIYGQVPAISSQYGWDQLGGQVAGQLLGYGSNYLSSALGDSEIGQGIGNIFSNATMSAGDTITRNLIRGQSFAQGLGQNVRGSVGGAAAGLASNYLGKGITSAMGNSNLGKFTGAAAANVGGTIGGAVLGGGGLGSVNPYGLAMNAIGSGLSAVTGPSKEYNGEYGNVTKTLDSVYSGIQSAASMFGPVGQIISGGMALNKGLSNIFGSTDGMTVQDSILGSAFAGAPLKWLNMAAAQKTSNFNNQSWQNSMKANSFMQNAFGNLSDRFENALSQAGKIYGTFSGKEFRNAEKNIMFANQAWNNILDMADQNRVQGIRSRDMTSINNQKYTQNIQGGFNTIARGKLGMKLLSNISNPDLIQRSLSTAALLGNEQSILSNISLNS